jgi:hypothetical protein
MYSKLSTRDITTMFEKVSALTADDHTFKSWKTAESKRRFELLLEERKELMASKAGTVSSESQSKTNRHMDRNLAGIPAAKDMQGGKDNPVIL